MGIKGRSKMTKDSSGARSTRRSVDLAAILDGEAPDARSRRALGRGPPRMAEAARPDRAPRDRADERFTLLGADARRGKLTLFDAEGRASAARSSGSACASRARRPRPVVDLGEGSSSCWSRRRPTPSSTSTTSRSSRPTRRGRRHGRTLGFAPGDDGRLEVGGAWLELRQGDPGTPERPLLNHIGVLVDSVEEHQAEAEELGVEIDDVVDAPNTLALFVWGPDRVKLEYIEHKPSFSPDLSDRRRRRRHGRPRRRGPRARARRDAGRAREGRPAGRLDAALERRRLAAPRASRTSARSARAASCGLQRRIVEELDDALDWLESLGVEPVARETGNPLTVGRRFDPRALTDVLVRAAGDVRLDEPSARREILATGGFGARLARERGLLLRANEWSEGDGLDYGVARGASLTAGHGRVLRPRAAGRGRRARLRLGRAALRAPRARARRRGRATSASAAWHESDLVQRLPGRPGLVRRRCAGASREPCGSARSRTWSRPRERRAAT